MRLDVECVDPPNYSGKKGALIDLSVAYSQYANWFFMRNSYLLGMSIIARASLY